MKALTVSVKVDIARPVGVETVRVAGFLDDGETIAVATMAESATQATSEIEIPIYQAVRIAEACLAGNERALTMPGLARILAASTALLCRVALAGGSLAEHIEGAEAHGHSGNRAKATADEHSGL